MPKSFIFSCHQWALIKWNHSTTQLKTNQKKEIWKCRNHREAATNALCCCIPDAVLCTTLEILPKPHVTIQKFPNLVYSSWLWGNSVSSAFYSSFRITRWKDLSIILVTRKSGIYNTKENLEGWDSYWIYMNNYI